MANLNGNSNNTEHVCSFCGKSQVAVKRLIAGPGRVFICDECVRLCEQIISEENNGAGTPPPSLGLSLIHI